MDLTKRYAGIMLKTVCSTLKSAVKTITKISAIPSPENLKPKTIEMLAAAISRNSGNRKTNIR